MRRRDFITGIAGSAVAWPRIARAQQSKSKPLRRVVVLLPQNANDPQTQSRNASFLQALQQLGWTVGQNIQIDYRWSGGSADDTRKDAAELITLAPEVILTSGTAGLGPLLQATRTIPIVFVNVPDPVGSGYVDSLARPGGNATGFVLFEYRMSGKWLELLKEIAPKVTRAAVIRDPNVTAGIGQWSAIQALAPSVGVEVTPVSVSDPAEIGRAVKSFAGSGNGGLIVTGSALTVIHRDLIIALAAQHKLPAVYYERYYVGAGGLMSYGPDFLD